MLILPKVWRLKCYLKEVGGLGLLQGKKMDSALSPLPKCCSSSFFLGFLLSFVLPLCAGTMQEEGLMEPLL